MSVSEPPLKTLRPAGPRDTSRAGSMGHVGLQKGQQTKAAIVDAALGLATQIGLEGLSIGALAEVMRMSKSGVFAHFGSREELQISVIREYFARFEEEVFYPALTEPTGLPRVQALFGNWMKRVAVELQSGCIFISGAVEFDDRPGPVRDALATSVQTWLAAMNRAVVLAKEAGHLRADADERQITFEIHGLILALHYEARFLKTPGSMDRTLRAFQSILARYGSDTTLAPATPAAALKKSAARPPRASSSSHSSSV
ncbi:TetR/AcrR family transcriptional regulator [Polaromonas sp. SM01]|uniref:TetR/AcrR family transcriptional regulator n=1 Tax=Polaromonas sp. SM01 TaxID=3085630 RepID=UPI00298129FD|nr:TetR/AcrR family transcriptional regulator [Polaromonas sp. SM01]MDW5443961.1 TetR/AcrR family transcriptional regulator [Polaromonas sp. SM01]